VKLEGDKVRFTVQERPAGGDWSTVYAGHGHSFVVKALLPASSYSYRVKVFHNDNQSDWSQHATVSTTRKSMSEVISLLAVRVFLYLKYRESSCFVLVMEDSN
jgi:hypothetical protein